MGLPTSSYLAEEQSSEPERQIKIDDEENTDNEQHPKEMTNQIELEETEPEIIQTEPNAVQARKSTNSRISEMGKTKQQRSPQLNKNYKKA